MSYETQLDNNVGRGEVVALVARNAPVEGANPSAWPG